jgi:tripartite-type tricarboxylate transporter receptor subunit TctC
MRKFSWVVLAALLLGFSTAADAQPWPSKPIRFVISFGPGSASDAMARITAQELTKQLGQPVVVIHKPGADGTISGVEVQRSAPDGYTFLMGSNSAITVAPLMRKQPPYNVLADFTPISLIGVNTLFFVVHPSVPAKSLAELVAYSKANPGKLNSGTGHTYGIVSTGLFNKKNGVVIEPIPYKSEPEAILDVLAGRVHIMVGTATAVLGHVREGKLRALAATTSERHPLLPDVPSLIEAGQDKHPFEAFFALIGPQGLPADIVTRMNKEMATALAHPEVREGMQKHGVIPRSSTVAEINEYLKGQNASWKAALESAGVEQQ